MLASITVTTFVLTFLLTRRWLYAGLDIVSQAILALGGTVSIIIGGAAYAASQERFSEKAFICMLGLYCLVALGALAWSVLKQKELKPGRSFSLSSLAVVLLIGVLYAPPSQIVIGGQDPSVYVATAKALANDRKVTFDSWSHRLLTAEESQQLLGMSGDPNRDNRIYNGVALKNDGSGRIRFYLARGPSYLLAFGFLFDQLETAFYVNCLYSLLAIYLFFLLAQHLLGTPWAGIAALLLALCPAELWFGRATYSEVASQFFILFSLYHLTLLSKRSDENQVHRFLLFAVALFAAAGAAMMRFDQALLLFLLIVLAPWARAGGAIGVLAGQLLGIALLVLVRFELDITAPRYVFAINREVFFAKHCAAWGIGIAAASTVFYSARIRETLIKLYTKISASIFSERGMALLSLAIIMFLVWGFVMRDLLFAKEFYGSDMNHNAGARTMDEVIFARMAVLCGPPIFVLSFWGMLFHVKSKRLQLATIALIGIWLAYGSVLFFSQRNSPMLYWASRRYLPVMVPTAVLFGCYMLAQFRLFRESRTNSLFAWLTAGISLIPMLIADRHLLWKGEMNGMLEMVHQLDGEFDRSSTVFLADASGRHYNFTFHFLGSFQVLQIPKLNEYEGTVAQMLPPLVQRLTSSGKTVVLLGDQKVNKAFGKVSSKEIKPLTAKYSRAGENLDQFPNTRWYRTHSWHYQVQ